MIGLRRAAGVAILYLAAAIVLTWPLAVHLGNATPSEWGDAKITTWVMAWDAHALAHHPTSLFQAPVFYPERDALAYADHLIALGVVAAPITWMTGNVYLAHNTVFILAIAFAGFAAFLLGLEVTKSRAAAIVTGTAFAAAPYWYGLIVNTSHIQILACGWIPMACFALIRWWRSHGIRWLTLLSVSAVMATLTSWHQAAYLAVALPIVAVGLVVERRPSRPLIAAGRLCLAGVVTAAAVLPFALPYLRVRDRDPAYRRSLAQAEEISARPSSFLAAPETNLVYGAVTSSARRKQTSIETELFPGVVVVLFSLVGVASVARRTSRRSITIAFAAIGAAGVVLALGTSSADFRRHLPWAWLSDHVLLFGAIRAPARANTLVVLALATLAGVGATQLTRIGERRGRIATAIVAIVVFCEGLAIPLDLGSAPVPDDLHRALADRPGAVLELPTQFGAGAARDATYRGRDLDYMLQGVAHWRPLVNGALGYTPASYRTLTAAIGTLPDDASTMVLRSRGVRTLVLHRNELSGTPWFDLEQELARDPSFRLIAESDEIAVYDIAPLASA